MDITIYQQRKASHRQFFCFMFVSMIVVVLYEITGCPSCLFGIGQVISWVKCGTMKMPPIKGETRMCVSVFYLFSLFFSDIWKWSYYYSGDMNED